jgi:ligand-binding SRPBCC domain-containing protein
MACYLGRHQPAWPGEQAENRTLSIHEQVPSTAMRYHRPAGGSSPRPTLGHARQSGRRKHPSASAADRALQGATGVRWRSTHGRADERCGAELLYAAAVPAVIEIVSDIDAAPSVVFDLELDVDVHAASLHGSQETATTSTGLRRLALGDEVTFRARHFGLRWQMTSRITVYERPHHFVDEQTDGPFRALRHEHHFQGVHGSGTRMIDRMTAKAPLGPLGAVVTRLLLAPYLRRLLKQRAAHIKHLAEARASGA